MVSSFSIITPFMIFCLFYVLVILEKSGPHEIGYFLISDIFCWWKKPLRKIRNFAPSSRQFVASQKNTVKKKDGTCKALTGSKCIWLILIFFHSTENVEWQYVHNRDISFVKFRIKFVLRIWYENWIRLKTNAMHNISSYE